MTCFLREAISGVFVLASFASVGCARADDADEPVEPAVLERVVEWKLNRIATLDELDSGGPEWVQAGLLHASGDIWIAGRGDHALAIYDSSTRLIRRLGRRGQGPGEHQTLGRRSLAHYRADSVVVHDIQLRRLSVYSAVGEFGRALAVLSPAELTRPHSLQFQGALDDGSFLFLGRENILDADRPELYRPNEPLLEYQANGENPHILRSVPGREQWRAPGSRSGSAGFARETIVVSRGGAYFVGATDTTVIEQVVGMRSLSLQVPGSPRPPSPAEIYAERERLRSEQLRQFRGLPANLLDARIAYAEQVVFPATLPVFDHLHAGADGELWVRLFSSQAAEGGAGVTWLIYDRESRLAARLSLPHGTSLLAADEHRALLLERLPGGEEKVGLYRIVKAA